MNALFALLLALPRPAPLTVVVAVEGLRVEHLVEPLASLAGAHFANARWQDLSTPWPAHLLTGAFGYQTGIVEADTVELIGTTLGDELVLGSQGASKVIALAANANTAALLAGRLGKALVAPPAEVVARALAAFTDERLGTDAYPDLLVLALAPPEQTSAQPEHPTEEPVHPRLERSAHLAAARSGSSRLEARSAESYRAILASVAGFFASVEKVMPATLFVLVGAPAARVELDPETLRGTAAEALERRFGAGAWVRASSSAGVTLDRELIAAKKLAAVEVEREAARALAQLPGIERCFTRTELLDGGVAATALGRAAVLGFHPARSGDVVVVPAAAATAAPVPLIMEGGVARIRVQRAVRLADLAPTLAALLGVNPPPSCEGEAIPEVLPSGARTSNAW